MESTKGALKIGLAISGALELSIVMELILAFDNSWADETEQETCDGTEEKIDVSGKTAAGDGQYSGKEREKKDKGRQSQV